MKKKILPEVNDVRLKCKNRPEYWRTLNTIVRRTQEEQ